MKIRRDISLLLLLLSLLLALLPLSANRSFTAKPAKLLSDVLNQDVSFTADQVAAFIVREDSSVQLIDLRSSDEFRKQAIPGAINIPYPEFIRRDQDVWLNNKNIRNIFCSTGDTESYYALVYARGLGYNNSYVMKGGITEWVRTVVEAKFTGDRITARENALFETRRLAGEMFTELNNLPDSLKTKFLESRKFSAKKLDGGCE